MSFDCSDLLDPTGPKHIKGSEAGLSEGLCGPMGVIILSEAYRGGLEVHLPCHLQQTCISTFSVHHILFSSVLGDVNDPGRQLSTLACMCV